MDANHVKDSVVDPPKTPLPEPDNDNITVLTSKLPNEPILPWNRYDSPWLESESPESEQPKQPEGAEGAGGSEGAVGAGESAGGEEESPAATSPAAESPVPESSDPNADAIGTQAEAPSPAAMPVLMSAPLEAEAQNTGVQAEVQNTEVKSDEAKPDEATPDGAIAPPLPTTNHYLIDLAFEGTTD